MACPTDNTIRSVHNVRIERLWRDVRKDCLESFRRIFMSLEEQELLDMNQPEHRSCVFLVFQKRIQASLDRAKEAWNFHQMSTEGSKSPLALFSISRQTAITRNYWTGDPGDPPEQALDPYYGFDGEAPMPPAQEQAEDPQELAEEDQASRWTTCTG